MLDRLAAWKHRYGAPDIDKLESLLDRVAEQRFTEPSDLIRLHETLLFLCAYPHSKGVVDRSKAMLANISGWDAAEFQDPEVSGIAGTSLTAIYSYEVARRLAAHVSIDWEAYDTLDRLGPVLRRFVPFLDEEWPVEAHTPFRKWIEAALPPGETDLHWLLARIADLDLSERDRADLYESLQLPLYWNLAGAQHTRSRVYQGPLYLHQEPLLRRKDVSLREAFEAPALPVERSAKSDAERILEIVLDTSAIRYRELYGFTHPDASHVYHVQAGRGLDIYWFGIPPQWRLPLRAYHAGMFFKNGVPLGYVEVLSLFDRAEVGFNLYYTFREGESAWIYARLLQLIHQALGVNTIVVDPYQIGHENDEALDSGAFWFYRKLGFGPVNPEIALLLEREERRIAGNPSHRSSRATLKKLAADYLRFDGPQAEPGAWDRFQLRRVIFAGAPIPNFTEWTPAEKTALDAILAAKRGPEESRYLRLMQKHRRLREVFLQLGSAGGDHHDP